MIIKIGLIRLIGPIINLACYLLLASEKALNCAFLCKSSGRQINFEDGQETIVVELLYQRNSFDDCLDVGDGFPCKVKFETQQSRVDRSYAP